MMFLQELFGLVLRRARVAHRDQVQARTKAVHYSGQTLKVASCTQLRSSSGLLEKPARLPPRLNRVVLGEVLLRRAERFVRRAGVIDTIDRDCQLSSEHHHQLFPLPAWSALPTSRRRQLAHPGESSPVSRHWPTSGSTGGA